MNAIAYRRALARRDVTAALPRPLDVALHVLRRVREHLAFVASADRDAVVTRAVAPLQLLRLVAAVAAVVQRGGANGRDVRTNRLALAPGHVVDGVHRLEPAAAGRMELLMVAAIEIVDELLPHREQRRRRRIRDPARVIERCAIRREVIVDALDD